MTDLAIVTGCFAHATAIKTRSTFQLIVEIPIELADSALKTLGGWPQPGKEKPVAVALLNTVPVQEPKAKRGSLAQQCGILCGDIVFLKFLSENYNTSWNVPTDDFEAAAMVRDICGVDSRAEFDTDVAAGQRWRDLHGQYLAWKTL